MCQSPLLPLMSSVQLSGKKVWSRLPIWKRILGLAARWILDEPSSGKPTERIGGGLFRYIRMEIIISICRRNMGGLLRPYMDKTIIIFSERLLDRFEKHRPLRFAPKLREG
jgi:hypothetical protein